MRFIEFMLAAANTPAPTTAPAPWWWSYVNNPILLIAGGLMLFMVFSGKNKRGEEKQRQEMLKQLKRGDRIQSIGGIQGAVVRVEENRVEVKVDESSNTKIWFARSAISKVTEAADKSDKSDAK